MSIEFLGSTKKSGCTARFRKTSCLLPLLAASLILPASSFLAGCAGNVGASPASSGPQQLSLRFTPPNLNFGSVNSGNKTSQVASVKNMGTGPATIGVIKSSSNQFAISGLNFPLTLAAGESTNFVVWFNGTTAGKTAGTLTFQGSDGGTSMVQLAVAGSVAALQPQLTVSPAVLDAGSAQVGSKTTSNVTLSNTGNADVIVSTITVNAAAFTITGITTPRVISAGQSATLGVVYAPTAAGTDSGSISITSNDPSSPVTTISLNATGTSAAVGHLTLNPSTLAFGGVSVGSSSVLSAIVTNTGVAAVHISSVFASGAAFSESGLTAPVALGAGQSAQIHVTYTPTASGLVGGTVGISSDAPGAAAGLSLSGTGVQAGISFAPASISFGSLVNGQSKSQPVVITNTGTASLNITQLSANGVGVSITGLTAPLTIAAGQSSTFNVQFAPQTSGSTNGTINVVSNAPNSPAGIAVTGTGVSATSTLSVSPAFLSFGNVNAGSSANQSLTITNTGNSNTTISQVSVSGQGFAASGVATPLTLAPSQSTTLSVQFSPATATALSGSIALVSQSGTTTVAATGTGVQAALAVSPAAVSFANVVAGSTNTQQIQISNTGNGSLTINQANVTGTGFSTTGLNLPLTLAAGQSSSFSVQFAAQSAGNVSGSVSLMSTAATSPATVLLTGSVTAAAATLSVSPASISFGSVNLGSAPAQTVTLTNTGNSNVTISQINVSGAGFMLSGAGVPVTLTPSQSLPVSVQFDPSAAGAVSGSVSVISNATSSPASVALSGTGAAQQTQHSVQLNWTGSSSTVAGYNVYRALTSGSGYTLINSGLVSLDDYSDSSVQSGQTYYYVTTAVDGSGNESAYSNEAQAIIP